MIDQANASTPMRRHPRHEEDALQIRCRHWFDMQHPKLRLLLHHSPNEGLLPKGERDGAKRKAMGVRAGFPDFIFLLPTQSSPYLCIELKTDKGRQSDTQKVYQALVESVGARYIIVRSLDEFITAINSYISSR